MTTKKLSERITPGPWKIRYGRSGIPERTKDAQLITELGPIGIDHNHWEGTYFNISDEDAEAIALVPDLLRVSEAMAEALRKALDQIPDYRDEDWPAPAHEGFCHPDAGCDATCSEIAAMSETMQVRRLLIQWLAEWEKLRK